MSPDNIIPHPKRKFRVCFELKIHILHPFDQIWSKCDFIANSLDMAKGQVFPAYGTGAILVAGFLDPLFRAAWAKFVPLGADVNEKVLLEHADWTLFVHLDFVLILIY